MGVPPSCVLSIDEADNSFRFAEISGLYHQRCLVPSLVIR